jgi:hypothetical protein
MCCLEFPKFQPLRCLETQGFWFSDLKTYFSTYFLLGIPRKDLKYLDKLINSHRKPHKNPKSTKNFPELRSSFLGNFKV